MKALLRAGLLVGLFCLVTGVVSAQDEPPVVIESIPPFYAPPALQQNACTDNTEATEICDLVATSPEDIVGVWTIYFQAEPMFIRYNADGTWLIADTAEKTTDAESVEGFPFGSYSFDEDGLFNSDDVPFDPALGPILEQCANNRYVVRVIKLGDQPVALNRVVLEECFAPRRADWAYASLWVSE